MNVFTLFNLALPPNFLVAQASGNLLQQAVAISFVGIAIVFFALLTIMVMLVVLKKLGESPEPRRQEKQVVPPAPQAAAHSQASPQSSIPAATVSASDSVQPKSTSPIVEPAAEEDEPEISPEIIAIITAAAIAALGTNVRIRKVRFADTTSNTAWAETGRRFIHTSHRLRKKDS
jgi:hypothetical protein